MEKSNWTLVYQDDGGYKYEVDLEQMKTSTQVLDWICQISEKEVPREDVGNLVQAFCDIFDHLPSTFQKGKQVDAVGLLKDKYGST